MPPPIEEEEDVIPTTLSTPYLLDWAHLADHTRQEIEHHEASDSDSDEVIELDENPLESEMFHVGDHTQQTPRFGPEFEPEPMLVVSDVVAKKAVPARTALPVLKPSKPETRTADKRRKRGVDVSFDTGPEMKRRRGDKRELPCTYCVRRLANDPTWSCHDALVGQSGIGTYSGFRCSECVGAHVACQLIPSKAKEHVRALVKAAADVAASDGTDRIPLLAAYEVAITPALHAIVKIPTPPEPQNQRNSQPEKRKGKRKKPRTKTPALLSTRSHATTPATNGNSSRTVAADSSFDNHNNHHDSFSAAGVADSYYTGQSRQFLHSEGGVNDPATFFASPPQHHHQDAEDFQQDAEDFQQDARDFERLERQALRRRKVEALESLAHTAALFLAEFMTFTKRQAPASSSFSSATLSSSAGPGEPGGSAPPPGHPQNHGVNYAAAAAGMVPSLFQNLTNSFTRSSGDGVDHDSDSDASDTGKVSNRGHPRGAAEDDDGDEEREPHGEDADADMEDANSDEDKEGAGQWLSELKVEEQ